MLTVRCYDMKIAVSVDHMRRSDAATIAGGVPSLELMRRAGEGVYRSYSWRDGVVILCGVGNNGGDGYVLASLLFQNGFSCRSQVEAELLRVICKKAKFLYMMLDSSKIGKIKPYTFARAEDLNVLITDNEFPDGLKDQFKALDIVVI